MSDTPCKVILDILHGLILEVESGGREDGTSYFHLEGCTVSRELYMYIHGESCDGTEFLFSGGIFVGFRCLS